MVKAEWSADSSADDWPADSWRLALTRIGGNAGGCHVEEFFADPVGGPVIFNGGGVVSFGQVVGHFLRSVTLQECAATPGVERALREGTTPQVSRRRARRRFE